MKKNRSQIFRELNVKPTNLRWAWCAKNESLRLSVFTLWKDEENNGVWTLHDDHNFYKKNGYFDQKSTLRIAIENDFEVLGIVVHAVDPAKAPRKIKSVDEDYLIKLKLVERDDKIFAKQIAKVSYLQVISKNKSTLKSHGLLDLETPPFGKELADRAFSQGFVFKRDQKVRSFVLKRAAGKCEYCGEEGFELKNGDKYIETHHIIALASQGKE